MNRCLECGKPAEHTEDYQGIPIHTCEDGHRTGQALEEKRSEPTKWESLFKRAS